MMTNLNRVQFTPTVDTSIYAANDTLFATTQVLGCFSRVGGKGFLKAVVVADTDDVGADIGLIFFNANTSAAAANAALSISDADAATILGVLDLGGTYLDVGGQKVLNLGNQEIPLSAVDGAGSIYVAGYVVSGTPTFTSASALKITLYVEEHH